MTFRGVRLRLPWPARCALSLPAANLIFFLLFFFTTNQISHIADLPLMETSWVWLTHTAPGLAGHCVFSLYRLKSVRITVNTQLLSPLSSPFAVKGTTEEQTHCWCSLSVGDSSVVVSMYVSNFNLQAVTHPFSWRPCIQLSPHVFPLVCFLSF